MLVCVFLYTIACETAGAARTRLSLRPLVLIEGGNRRKARAHRAARSRGCVCDTRCLKIESADTYRARMRHIPHVVIARLDRATQGGFNRSSQHFVYGLLVG